jgi:phosphatidylglycerol:prolipoprotein diacylglycerol transferase
MWPRIGPVPTYGILYIVSFISCFIASFHFAKKLGLRHRVWITAGICYMVGMAFGAKVLYDIHSGQFDLRALFSISHYLRGGLWGGLLAYLVLAVPLVVISSKRKWEALDLVGLSIPIPWIFVKLACLFNGCCYGKACSLPWAISFPENTGGAPVGIPLHPTQIYEILVVVCIFIVFKFLKYPRWRGTMLLWFLFLYGTGRAVTEFFRGDVEHHFHIGGLTLSQIICFASAGVSIILLLLRRRFVSNETLD